MKSKIVAVTVLGALALGKLTAGEAVFQREKDGYTGAVDAYLAGEMESNRIEDHWGDEEIRVAGLPEGGMRLCGLLRFGDIVGKAATQIPPGAKITSASLEVYKVGEPADSGQYANKSDQHFHITLYRMLKPFQAGVPDVDSNGGKFACYSYRSYGGDVEEMWGDRNQIESGPVRGVDYDAGPVATINSVELGTSGWYGVDVTELVRKWVDGSAPNEGIFLQAHGYWIGTYFASGNHRDSDLRPKLTVQWE